MTRDRFQKQSLGVLTQQIAQARVLLVGAGGIGCELLKNLVLTGYGEIHIIDLDTIDLSNLNRQFLFRQEHIKKPKATVAKDVAQRLNPNVKLVAYHADIRDTQFSVTWFQQFSLVFNALDNLEARRQVNRMCLAADVPLIESGTTGFNGQVQVIKKGKTACYDCTPKATPKSFPVCTIRTTPSQPIHCIVWAKSYLFPELFGESEETVPDIDVSADAENAEEIANLKIEAEALKNIRSAMGSDTFAKQVFDKVFKEDIERLAQMEDVWKNGRKRPVALSFEDLSKEVESANIDSQVSTLDQRVWTLLENFSLFVSSLGALSRRFQSGAETAGAEGDTKPMLMFDKDDDSTLDFVTAAANLRSHIFGIEAKSKFDIKQMAGNVIPAIATTNAMIAGLCVMQAFKVMKGDYAGSKMIFLDRGNISAGNVDKPNPECAVCATVMARIQVDTSKATLGYLVNSILKQDLGYQDEISVLNGDGGVVFDPDMEDNLEKQLDQVGIKPGGIAIVKDDGDDTPRVDLQLFVENGNETGVDTKPIKLVLKDGEKLTIPERPTMAPASVLLSASSEVAQIQENGTLQTGGNAKRKRSVDEDRNGDQPVKKIQLTDRTSPKDQANGAIWVEEEEGAIQID